MKDNSLRMNMYYKKAYDVVIQSQRASTALLQRELGIGYSTATRLIEMLERKGAIKRKEDRHSQYELNTAGPAPTNIYLDIDGVLLANNKQPALYAKEFLSYILEHFPNTTYWLTTHCMHDDAMEPIRNVGHLFDAETVALMKKIKPTEWRIAKTEAIDFSKPFLWFDDDCYSEEHVALVQHGALESWVEVNLSNDKYQLRTLIENFPK